MHDARDLSRRIASLLAEERNCLADFLAALAEFDRARGWAALGYASLFQYLERELKLTSSAAAARQTAVRLILQLPALVQPIRDGRICLSVVYELAKALTPENAPEVLPRFYGLSKRDAEALVAELRPFANPPRREVVTAVARTAPSAAAAPTASAPAEEPTAAPVPERTSPAESERVHGAGADLFSAPARPRDDIQPLTAELRRLHLTVSKAFIDKLDAAKDALSHSISDGDTEAVLSAALDLLLERTAKRRARVKKPRPAPARTPTDPRHIPAAIAREVWRRDGERCAFRLPDGRACGSTVRLQLDHITPVALGGTSTVENVRVTCASHNVLAARWVFGDGWMDRFTRRNIDQRPTMKVRLGTSATPA